MLIKDILKDIDSFEIYGNKNLDISEIVYDSRKAAPGSLFICIDGFNEDGHDYIDNAVNNGSVAVLIEKKLEDYRDDLTYVKVNDSRQAMSYLARTFYDYPLEKLKLIGVTGTNGKTTTTYLIKSIIDQAGFKTGLIGTINVIIGKERLPATRTTPESLDLYRYYHKMFQSGVKYVVMEVSSHALDLKRVQGIKFDAAVFTNISQDHLDYHKSISDYLKAKSRLFKQLKKSGTGIINIDDNYAEDIITATNGDYLTYGLDKGADIKASNIDLNARGVSFSVNDNKINDINLNLTGRFNVYNSLAAIGATKALNFDEDDIKNGLENIKGVPGRFELIDKGQDFAVVVDYAHTPDGMENVLQTVLEFVKGDIIVVFGCGGDRDQGKRPQMGQIAVKYGDECILTSDNPRSEDPLYILDQIEAGIKKTDFDTPYQVIPDRKQAIYSGVKKAQSEDMVIIFGKGHETYQVFKDKTIHFDDREIARKALSASQEGEL